MSSNLLLLTFYLAVILPQIVTSVNNPHESANLPKHIYIHTSQKIDPITIHLDIHTVHSGDHPSASDILTVATDEDTKSATSRPKHNKTRKLVTPPEFDGRLTRKPKPRPVPSINRRSSIGISLAEPSLGIQKSKDEGLALSRESGSVKREVKGLRAGVLSPLLPADADVKKIVKKLETDIRIEVCDLLKKKCKVKDSSGLEVISYKKKVMAATSYFVILKMEGSWFHVEIIEIPKKGELELVEVDGPKQKTDKLIYM